MGHSLIALLVVNVALATGISGSILHAPGVHYSQLIPYDVTYSGAHSPVLLSHPLDLNVQAALAAAGYATSSAPVAEVSLEQQEIPSNPLNTEQSINSIGVAASSSPESPLPEAESPPPLPVEPLPAPTSIGSASAESASPLPSPSTEPQSAAPAAESPSPAPISSSPSAESETPLPSGETAAGELAPQADTKLLDSITQGAFYIDSDGKLQMQASYISSGEVLPIGATADLASPVGAVPVVVPEVPVVVAGKTPKPHGVSNVNVNVNVNVNGDGTGSAFNATSVSKIIAPIAVNPKHH